MSFVPDCSRFNISIISAHVSPSFRIDFLFPTCKCSIYDDLIRSVGIDGEMTSAMTVAKSPAAANSIILIVVHVVDPDVRP